MVLLLIAVTWPLWFPSGSRSIYPRLPLLDLPIFEPAAVGWIASSVLVTALATLSLEFVFAKIFSSSVFFSNSQNGPQNGPSRLRWLWWVVAGSLIVSFLIDQHRLQPWAYQTAIYAVVIAGLPAYRSRQVLIVIAASIYLYSAWGKFDYQFLHTVGQDFLNALMSPVGGVPESWSPSFRARIALLFPIGELSIGLTLLVPATRRIAGAVAMLMHMMLIALLGPWCLDHSTGVLVWNAALLIQAYWLIMKSDLDASTGARSDRTSSISASLAWLVVLVVLLAPWTERHGYWDHWTSWALYSPHSSRAEIELHQSVVSSLPQRVRSFVDADSDGDRWQTLSVGRWSLQGRRVAVYPQSRYQLLFADQMASKFALEDGIRVRQRGVSDRWTGKRHERRFLGAAEIRAGLSQFWSVAIRSNR